MSELLIKIIETQEPVTRTFYVIDGDGTEIAGPFDTHYEATEAQREVQVKAERRAKFDRGSDAMGHVLPGHFESRG
jgi:hypothetical protein